MSKGLEALKDFKEHYFFEFDEEENLNVIEKELKALEIIKNKEVNMHHLLLHLKRFNYSDGYNVLVGEKYRLTQEEYDLLKEVIL